MDLSHFGLSAKDFEEQVHSVNYPTQVQGRTAHLDADFLAYQVSAESRDELDGLKERKSLEDMQHNARTAVDHLRMLAGATSAVCHVTPSGSNKGGRSAQAVQQEYQGNRTDKERPEFLDAIRHFIVQELNGIAHLDQEADDGMTQANYDAMGAKGSWGNSNLSVIVSQDKDLCMVPGLHLIQATGELFCVGDPWGSIYIEEKQRTSPSTGKVTTERKLKGWGTKFFWAQCLMGDTADHIKGIPGIPGSVAMTMAPTAAYTKAQDALRLCGPAPTTPALQSNRQKYADQIMAMETVPKLCGPVLTYDVLKDVHTDKDAFQLVRGLWQKLGETHEFFHWQTGAGVTPTQALLGDMQLLWMRRNKNPLDVVAWLKGE